MDLFRKIINPSTAKEILEPLCEQDKISADDKIVLKGVCQQFYRKTINRPYQKEDFMRHVEQYKTKMKNK